MRIKIALFAIIMTAIVGGVERLHAVSLSNENMQAWRSTETSTVDSDTIVATGTVFIYKITVSSGSTGISQFQYFNTTGTIAGGVTRSSSVVYDIDTTADSWEVKDILNSGFRYTKTGNASIRVLWDWVFQVPAGQAGRGYK